VILPLVLLTMAALAVITPLITTALRRNAGYVLAAGFCGVGVLLGTQMGNVLAGRTLTASLPWIPALGVSATLRLDGLAALFCLLVLGVGVLIMGYCPRYLQPDGRHTQIYVLLTLFGTAMLGLVLADDLVLLFVFWELTSVFSFLLIGAGREGAVRPAIRAIVVTSFGGLGLLVAVILLEATGTTRLSDILARPELILDSWLAFPIGTLIVLAAFTKSAQIPFQFWLPGAMVAITPVSAYLHAATMVKAGIYLLMRFAPVYSGEIVWSATLVVIGLATAVYGALVALREHDLKALLAYSTVSQLGLIISVIGVGTPVALAAAALHTFAHALFKATLFMLVGIIDREAGSRDLRQLSGLWRVMPITAVLTGLAALSLAGVPPLLGFVSKETVFQGLFQAAFTPWAGTLVGVTGVVASALTFAYSMRIFYDAFGGPTLQRQLYEPSLAFLAPAAVSAVAGLALGLAVAYLAPVVRRAIVDMEPSADVPEFALWHGWSPELALSAATIVVGTVLFLIRDRVDLVLSHLPSSASGRGFDRLYAGLLRLGAVSTAPAQRAGLSWYVAPIFGGLVALAVAGMVMRGPLPAPPAPTSRLGDVPVVTLLALAVAGLVTTRSALTAIASVGLVGIVVTGWLLLAGAPDVALTLLVVEVLTAVVAMLVLRRLPLEFARPARWRTAWTAGLGLLIGLAAAAATWEFTGRRGLSPVGKDLLRSAVPETGGHNVVNVILVEFRALDTLGEATVLGVAAMGLLTLLGPRRLGDGRHGRGEEALPPGGVEFVVTYRALAPGMVLLSAYLFLRGHNHPGGGFIAALVAGTALAFGCLAFGAATQWRPPPGPLIAGGLLLSVGVATAATVAGLPFLTPAHVELDVPGVGTITLSSALLFDLGVYSLVLGLLATALGRLAGGSADDGEYDDRSGKGSSPHGSHPEGAP
jgi:multicomponent Na+:H+ antiporter subunit A